jgi:hypothetical protein
MNNTFTFISLFSSNQNNSGIKSLFASSEGAETAGTVASSSWGTSSSSSRDSIFGAETAGTVAFSSAPSSSSFSSSGCSSFSVIG